MKKWIKLELSLVLLVLFVSFMESCKEKKSKENVEIALSLEPTTTATKNPISSEFKDYWYAGEAEITSYNLEQARYGEMRDGSAVLIFVTEPFHAEKQVKADQSSPNNIPVLKLNSTKNYLTGIYPYSIMTSSFYSVHDNDHATKVTFSSQEWCGHVFAQINNREKFEIDTHSYFESESDVRTSLNKTVLEDEIWSKIRINPTSLPIGSMKIIPSMEYLRLTHKEFKAYEAELNLHTTDTLNVYSIKYPALDRTLEISFSKEFPYTIESWTDAYKGGYGSEATIMTSRASRKKTIKSPYWQKSSNKFLHLRDSLGL